ncbi:MAG: tRNA pseudouridine(38-40) synthase TruA [Cyclobacteriaceae bacterium]|nr:tRNA pseudouridine(38-40) synthase TruA [Cyclobacteriaceae bacterium HetDA_MAG_MS6]
MRYFLDISYLGTQYHGWQLQNNAISIQQVLEKALTTILQVPTSCTGSGRTDTGVHARQQVAHFDTDVVLDELDFVYKLNSFLPGDIAVNSCRQVNDEAHARFDATRRSYQYFIHQNKNPFQQDKSYFFSPKLDFGQMNRGADMLSKWEDFQSFSKVNTDVNHFNCIIYEAKWEQENDSIVFSVSANRFLRGMVRAMVGTLLDLGLTKIDLKQLKEILESRHRSAAGRAVPAEGLYLTEVAYPNDIYLAE